MLCDFGDVEEAVGAREDFNEGAELSQANDLAKICSAYFRHCGDVRDHLNGAGEAVGVARCHVDAACVVDIDLDASGVDDAANDLAAGSDEVADLVGGDLDGVNAGSELRLLFVRAWLHGVHLVKEPELTYASLFERLAHNLGCDAHDLDVHLQRRDALTGSGNLEVHVAVMIFGTCDVGKDGVVIAFLDEAHGDTSNGAFDGDSSGHQRKRSSADSCHGGRTVRLKDVGNDAESVWRYILARQDGFESAPCECAVADLATAYAGHTSNLTNGERRKVVVEHELALLLALVAFHTLCVVGGTESYGDESLSFAARKERRAMDARKNAHLNADLANLVEGAMVGADALVQNLLAEDGFAKLLVILGKLLGSGRVVLWQIFLELVLDFLDQGVALKLGMLLRVERILEAVADLGGDVAEVCGIVFEFGDDTLCLAGA